MTSRESMYPRVLVIAIARINAADTNNNGLLLRSLLSGWPRERLAQIYSSGDNGDGGSLGDYYRLGPKDRRFGRLFYRLKAEAQTEDRSAEFVATQPGRGAIGSVIRRWLRRMVVDTGLYELLFKPRVSAAMAQWVNEFAPDVILAQGYNLTFALLPVLLKARCGARLAFFCSDDWPTYLYSGRLGEPRFLRWLLRPAVARATARLIKGCDIPLAFGEPMAEEYAKRYGMVFEVLSHADDPSRFAGKEPIHVHLQGTRTILLIGALNRFRWPLVLDADECCRLLAEAGINARVAVISSAIDPEGRSQLGKAKYVDIFPDPGNDALPCYLAGADVLLLAEGFDEGFVSAIRLSISSKAHLFMFSRRPIVVYAHADTGISRYARRYGWAQVVDERSPLRLYAALLSLLDEPCQAAMLVHKAFDTAMALHTTDANRQKLLASFCTIRG